MTQQLSGQMPPEHIETIMASLAAELATRLLPTSEVLRRHGMTAQQLQTMMNDPQFKHMIREYRRQWNNPLSARDRVKARASLAVEDGLIDLYTLYQDVTLNPTARLDAYKTLINLADMQPKTAPVSGGSSFSLTIELAGDGDGKGITINAEPRPEEDVGEQTELVIGGDRDGD